MKTAKQIYQEITKLVPRVVLSVADTGYTYNDKPIVYIVDNGKYIIIRVDGDNTDIAIAYNSRDIR